MAITATYYFDGSSFATSNYLFTDAGLTAEAPQGFYSIGGIVREVTNNFGLLGPVQACPSCIPNCGTAVAPGGLPTEGPGMYSQTFDVGNTTGAIIITVNPGSENVGFTWIYNGVVASEYTNATHGYLQGVIGIENPPSGCTGLPLTNALGSNGLTLNGNTYTYNNSTGAYTQGNGVVLGPITNQAAGGVDLTPLAPGNSYMVIPKPFASPSTIIIKALVTCDTADFSISVDCPVTLQPFEGTASAVDCTAACALSYTTNYYNVPAATPTPPLGVPSVNDWVFLDENAVDEVPDGTYKVSVSGVPHCMVVAEGVITTLTAC